jgi:hypothetical protein
LIEKQLDLYPIKNEKIIAYRIIGNQTIIINLRDGIFNTLNGVATKIWELSDGKSKVRDIIKNIHDEFQIDINDLKTDCTEFIFQMIDKNLLSLSSSVKRQN